MSVCSVLALTFKSFGLETSFLVCVYAQLQIIYRSSSYIKVIRSRSRSHEQDKRVCASCLRAEHVSGAGAAKFPLAAQTYFCHFRSRSSATSRSRFSQFFHTRSLFRSRSPDFWPALLPLRTRSNVLNRKLKKWVILNDSTAGRRNSFRLWESVLMNVIGLYV